jgi:hypothetical protein
MLRGSISRPTNCLQLSPAFRPQLHLPVIGLTTWVFGLGDRVGVRPWEILRCALNDPVYLAFSVTVIVRSKTCATRFYDEAICLFGGLLLRIGRLPRHKIPLRSFCTSQWRLELVLLLLTVNTLNAVNQFPWQASPPRCLGAVEVKRWVTKALKLFYAPRLGGLIHWWPSSEHWAPITNHRITSLILVFV